MNSDAGEFGGSGMKTRSRLTAEAVPFHGQPFSIRIALPPFSALLFKHKTAPKRTEAEPPEEFPDTVDRTTKGKGK
ncbi:1,4-alpha-glucan branching enzyme GlgB [compost metagenome]